MGEAVIVAAVRTPIGVAYRGVFANTSVVELGKVVVAEAIKRSGVAPDDVDDLILGEVMQGGGCLARYLALDLGLPADTPGLAVQRQCGTGLQAVNSAAASIRAGMDRVIVAGGAESMTQAPQTFFKSPAPWGGVAPGISDSHPETPDAPTRNMGITVGENTAAQCGVTRAEQDEWSYHSHQRAIAATDDGRFAHEIVPVDVVVGRESRVVEVDEKPRRDTTLEKLAALPPAFKPGGTVTAGNSSSLNDGACALVVVDESYAQEHGLSPLARIRAWAAAGVPPAETGIAPTIAIPRALARAGLATDDIALVEINEAFASMAVASSRILGFPHEIVNVNGSGCSLGHPVACTGARMVTTLMYELRRRGGGIGVASMCAGGGMGSATVIEVMPG
jgi:acetyl-CoA C-acetyltransferase